MNLNESKKKFWQIMLVHKLLAFYPLLYLQQFIMQKMFLFRKKILMI